MTAAALPAWGVLWAGCAAYSAAGATVVQHDRIRWFATGVGYEGLNGVFVAPGTAAVPVEDALRTFQRLRVPALWHVGVAGEVQHVVTLPGFPGRGVSTALTVAALRCIAARGVRTAVLTSSPDGLGIYRRLGFRTVGAVRRYLWYPEESHYATVITQTAGARNIAVPSSDVGIRGRYPAQAWVQRPAMPS